MDDPRLSRRRMLAGTGLALSVGVAGCAVSAPEVTDNGEPEPTSGFPDEFADPPEDLAEPPADSELTEVYRAAVKSVAAVRLEEMGQTGAGTAWVYDDEYLVTNEHVVREAEDPFVWFTDNGWREASVVGTDLHSDLAVLEVVEGKPDDISALPLAESPPPVGTPVAAIGNPFELTGSFTTGVISGRDRTIEIPGRDFSIADGVQTDAALNPGNSGGPLITYDGEVVGVVSAGQGENIGFAISAAMTNRVVPSLIEDGTYEHSYLGILSVDVTPDIIEANDLGDVTWGVYVNEVLPTGPSSGALQETTDTTTVRGATVPVGGDVIVGLDDWEIQTGERLSAFLALETEPGQTIDVTVIRDGQEVVEEVTLERRPEGGI